MVFARYGGLMVRSKLAYGRTMSTLDVPVMESAIWNVKLQLLSVRF